MHYEKERVEDVRFLDSFCRGGRRRFRMDFQRGNTGIYREDYKAGFISAKYCISDCMDGFIRAYGDRSLPRVSQLCFASAFPQPAAVYCAVGVKLFLANYFFQFAELWLCLFLACRAVDFNLADDFVLPQSRRTRSVAATALSALGDLRCVFEFGSLAVELIA